MWPHYWCGYLLVLFSVVHAWTAMQTRTVREMNQTGLWFATAATALLLFQIAFGLLLQDRGLQKRKLTRRWHYWIMLAIVLTVAAHIWLNG
jgi:uncharacterized membrane protein